jgi:predicted ATPase
MNPLFPGIFIPARYRTASQENTARFGQLDIIGSQYDLVEALSIIEPRLKRLSTIVVGKTPMLYGDIGLPRMLSLAQMGDGLGGFLSLLLAISNAPGGVVLIDEIDSGLHYSILTNVWKTIADVARRYNTQVIATTHNWECIKAAHEAFITSDIYDFSYHRLEKINGSIEAITIGKDSLQTMLDSGWEIR